MNELNVNVKSGGKADKNRASRRDEFETEYLYRVHSALTHTHTTHTNITKTPETYKTNPLHHQYETVRATNNEMDVLNSAIEILPQTIKSIDVECIQRITWPSFWGPEVYCAPSINVHNAHSTQQLLPFAWHTPAGRLANAATSVTAAAAAAKATAVAATSTVAQDNFPFSIGSNSSRNADVSPSTPVSSVHHNQSALLESAVDTFKCSLSTHARHEDEAIFNCTATTAETYAHNVRQYLNDALHTVANCVHHHVSIVIKSVRNPVSELELILPKLHNAHEQLAELNTNLNRTVVEFVRGNVRNCATVSAAASAHNISSNSSGSSHSISNSDNDANICVNLSQVLICNNLVANRSFYENDSFENTTTNSTFMESVKCLLNLYCSASNHTKSVYDNDTLSTNSESLVSTVTATATAATTTIINQYYGNVSGTTAIFDFTDDGGGHNATVTTEAIEYDWTFLLAIIFIVAGSLGNILVCLAVALDRKLQNVTNYFLFSLAIADLLVSLFVMPLGAIPSFLGKCFVRSLTPSFISPSFISDFFFFLCII